jgi:voltage-gated sodium channel
VLHCLRILELLPKTKHILDGLAHSFTGIINVVSICFVFFYVFGLMATDMFNEWDPQNFGNLGASLLSLFTLMASGGVTDLKDIYTAHPVAWVLIISFVVIMSYFILNLVIGVIVGAMAKAEDEIEAIGGPSVYEKAIMDMGQELNLLRNEIADLKKELTQQGK